MKRQWVVSPRTTRFCAKTVDVLIRRTQGKLRIKFHVAYPREMHHAQLRHAEAEFRDPDRSGRTTQRSRTWRLSGSGGFAYMQSGTHIAASTGRRFPASYGSKPGHRE